MNRAIPGSCFSFVASLLVVGLLSTACGRAPEAPKLAEASSMAASAPETGSSTPDEPALPTVLVHKSPNCGCCSLWIDHLRQAGFPVEERNTDDIQPVKSRLGVPPGKGSCHTAEVDGYMVEGHVPAEDILRLLTERPEARGLVLPGMPMGSPGMEVSDGRVQPYTVELVALDGTTTPFSRHGSPQP